MYKALLVVLIFPVVAFAHVPVLPQFYSDENVVNIDRPEVSQAFYSELGGFPHRYQFSLVQKQQVAIEILVPDIKEAQNNISGTIERGEGGALVEFISDMEPSDAKWESFYEPFGGDHYRQGPKYSGELEPGEYSIEIYNDSNRGKYVMVVGDIEDFSDVGFWETLQRIYLVKVFFGKSPIAVLQSPFYLVPFTALILISLTIWYRKRKSYA